MRQFLNTLFVTTPNAYLRLEGDTVCVEVDRKKQLQVPLHHLGSVVTFGDVMMSPALVRRCAADGRGLILLDRYGKFSARMEGPVSGNILLRRAQHHALDDEETAVSFARACIAGKLRNSRYLLRRGARDAKHPEDISCLQQSAEQLAQRIKQLPNTKSLETLRGAEGDAARLYFAAIPYLIRHDQRGTFQFDQRSRRPPLDPFNTLISFLYTLLTHDCRSALEGVGLDPQLGFLHALRPGRPALALDLMEEFRPVMADRLALTLINRGQLNSKHFVKRTGGAVHLNEQGRKIVLTAYQERKQEEVRHPVLAQTAPIGLLPHVQARFLARVLRGDMESYIPFIQH